MSKLKKLGSNMTEIIYGEFPNRTCILYSYDTPVAGFCNDIGAFRTNRSYSQTTTKHINKYFVIKAINTVATSCDIGQPVSPTEIKAIIKAAYALEVEAV